MSNLTYRVTDGTTTWVVRRPPLGHVLATAHDMARECRVITALAGTSVPVPPVIALCEDTDVIGAPFYVMDEVPGVVLRSPAAALALDRTASERTIRFLSARLVEVLAALHALDPEQLGLADFGRPEGFLDRQLRRWVRQLDASRSRDITGIDELARRLGERTPATQRVAIVHGDYKLDNVIVNRIGDRYDIAAVVDWEMSTLGDPLTDVGLLLVYWSGMGSPDRVPHPGAGDAPPPFPASTELASWYATASGRDLGPLPWYVAFACFKLAVIVEQIHYRHSLGKTVGTGFAGIGDLTAPLVARGHQELETWEAAS